MPKLLLLPFLELFELQGHKRKETQREKREKRKIDNEPTHGRKYRVVSDVGLYKVTVAAAGAKYIHLD